MRDTGAQSALEPFGMAHVLTLSGLDIALALVESSQDSQRIQGNNSPFQWEPVSLGELISFHRQAFLWRFLMERPRLLFKNLAGDFGIEKPSP